MGSVNSLYCQYKESPTSCIIDMYCWGGESATPCIVHQGSHNSLYCQKNSLTQAILLLLWTSNVNDIETKAPTIRYQSFWCMQIVYVLPKILEQSKAIWIWIGNSHRQSKMLLFNPKTNRSKHNVLIWFASYRNESKTSWFGQKNLILQAGRLRFGPQLLGQSKAIRFGLETVLGKIECFYFIPKLIDRRKTFFWFWSAYYLKRKQNVLIWSAYDWNKSKTLIILSLQRQKVSIWHLAILLAGERNTLCMSILLVVVSRPYCWLRNWMHPARPYC